MKPNRRVIARRNSDKSQKRKSGNSRTKLKSSATERKQVEEKLLASEVRYRRLFETAKDGILILDAKTGEIVDVNPFLMEMLGYSYAELLGKQLWEIGLCKDILANKDSFFRLQEEKYIRYENLPLKNKDGNTIWVEFVSNAYDVSGKQVIQCNIRDITDRKRAEEALVKEQHEMQIIMDNLPVNIYFKDRASRFTRVSKTHALQFGLSDPAQLIGKTDFDFFTIEHAQQAYDDEQAIIQAGQTLIKEEKETWIDRPPTWALTIKMPMRDTQGNITGTFGLSTDITEHKQAEEKIQQQLRRLSALRDIDLVINSNFDLKVTLDILLGHVIAQLGVDAAAVLLFHPGMNELEFAAGRGFHTANITHLRLKLGEDYPGRAALERRTIAIYNLAKSQEPFENRFIEDEGFATFFAVPLIAKGKVKGVLDVFHHSPFTADADWLNFLEGLAGQTAIAIDNSELLGNLQQSNLELQLAYDKTIEGWSRALDLRDKETEGHTQRVTKTALRLARAMGLGEDELIQVRRGALLHDIGKIGVPDQILLKPGELTEEELAAMKKHPQFAFDLFSSIDFIRPALDIPYCHHEKWDGTGYPRGLKGEQIPLTARIFAVVDVYDALTSDRPYRQAWTKEKAIEHIQSEAGKYFDPNVVQEFVEVIKKD